MVRKSVEVAGLCRTSRPGRSGRSGGCTGHGWTGRPAGSPARRWGSRRRGPQRPMPAAGHNIGLQSTSQSQHSHSTVTAQSQHSHSTATAQSRDANRAQHRIVKHQSAPDVHGHPKLEHIAQRVYSGRCRVETCLRNGPNQLSNESIMPKSRIPQSPPSWRPGTQPRSLCGMPATYGNGA